MIASPPLTRRWSVVKPDTRRIVYLVDRVDFGHPGWTGNLDYARRTAGEVGGSVVDADWLSANFATWLATGVVPTDALP